MLILKPNCEWCNMDLAPDANNAMICSYECTFCYDCVDRILINVCPNCGGGFTERPIRPQKERRVGVSVRHHPASTERVKSKYSLADIKSFTALHKDTPAAQR